MSLRITSRRLPSLGLGKAFPALVAVFGFLGPQVSSGQAPAANQLEVFQNLPAAQQQAILDALGSGSGATALGRSDAPLEFPKTVEPKSNAAPEVADRSRAETRLRGGDTVLLRLEIRNSNPGTARQTLLPQATTSPAQSTVQQQVGPAPAALADQVARTPEQVRILKQTQEGIERRNPYRLDRNGSLIVPELGSVPLAGLDIYQARLRLAAEPLLAEFNLELTLLPLEAVGVAALKPFGYDLFAGTPSTFAPATDIPVPTEYIIGPGDMLQVQLTGNSRGTYKLAVGRNGEVNFPELGPIAVAGRTFDAARAQLEQRVAEQLIGTRVSVAMGELRSIRVFVLGEAERPGSYTVSGLSTMTNALFASGGVKTIGSLRKIELKRNGVTVSRLDLYDLLLRGDTRGDARVQPGDVIFIPPVGAVAGIAGEVLRPALYELSGAEAAVADVLALGGGLTAMAEPRLGTLERIDGQRRRTVADIDLSGGAVSGTRVRNGDVLRVPTVRPVLEDTVTISGHVYRPGEIQFRNGMRLSDAISSFDELQPNADQQYVLIRRERVPDRRVQILSADLSRALAVRGSPADIALAARDRIVVFDLEASRERVIAPLIRELQMQSRFQEPLQVASVSGRIKVPGQYPLEPGMRVSDLIRAGGRLDDAAYGGTAELTRYDVVDGESRRSELIEVNLDRVLAGDPAANLELRPFDLLVIKELPDWRRQEQVEIVGEVRFPGVYPIRRGETLRSVLERAGGVTDLAFSEGSVFTRTTLKERERQQIADLTRRMQADLAQAALMATQETGRNAAQALSVGQSLLASLQAAEPVGRLVISLPESMRAAAGSEQDIVLKNGDRLVVPRVTQEVTVIGEVQSSTSHLYDPALGRSDYIQLSGGVTQRADKRRAYVVRADGSVVGGAGAAWFSRAATDVRPGDTVVVPLDVERIPLLPTLTSITQILYNIAVAVAAVNSF